MPPYPLTESVAQFSGVRSTAPEFVNDEGYSAYKGGAVPEDKKHYKQRAHDIYLWTVPLKRSRP